LRPMWLGRYFGYFVSTFLPVEFNSGVYSETLERYMKVVNGGYGTRPSSCPYYVCNVRLAFGLPLLCSQPNAIDRYLSDHFHVVTDFAP
jgi:hypothetical protein